MTVGDATIAGDGIPGVADQPYDVIAFDEAGNTEVFASYRP
ncbi:MAG: hypothetical protein R3E31_18625 [Chloroflexota bacterium]